MRRKPRMRQSSNGRTPKISETPVQVRHACNNPNRTLEGCILYGRREVRLRKCDRLIRSKSKGQCEQRPGILWG